MHGQPLAEAHTEANAMKHKLVMIGNGMAGVRTLEELLKLDAEQYDITVFGAEPHPNYNRIMLSPVLSGDKTVDDIVLNGWEWYEENNISLITGDPVVEIDRVNCRVTSRDGISADYDRLLITTGSNPFIIPVPGHDKQGVIGFRDIADVEAMLEATRSQTSAGHWRRIAGAGSRQRSAEAGHEGERGAPAGQPDGAAAGQDGLGAVADRWNSAACASGWAQTAEILGAERVTGVRFADGARQADLVVMAGHTPEFRPGRTGWPAL